MQMESWSKMETMSTTEAQLTEAADRLLAAAGVCLGDAPEAVETFSEPEEKFLAKGKRDVEPDEELDDEEEDEDDDVLDDDDDEDDDEEDDDFDEEEFEEEFEDDELDEDDDIFYDDDDDE